MATAIEIRENMIKMAFAVVLLVFSFICCSSALYFHIGETEKKCFIEDIPDETMVVGEPLGVCVVNSCHCISIAYLKCVRRDFYSFVASPVRLH